MTTLNAHDPRIGLNPSNAVPMPKARITDPETSHIAARRITRHHITKEINFIMTALLCRDYDHTTDRSGLTDPELFALAQKQDREFSPSGLRTRRHELCALKLIDSYQKIEMEGRTFKLWILTHRGKQVIDWLNTHEGYTEKEMFPFIETIIQELIQQDQS